MASDSTFHCSVVTPERAVLETDARSVVFPAWDGEIGILRGRAPLLCRLGVGPMKITGADATHVLLVDGGFAQMVENRLTILTEQAREPSVLERQAAEKALDEAKARPITDDQSFTDRDRAIRRAQAEIKMAS